MSLKIVLENVPAEVSQILYLSSTMFVSADTFCRTIFRLIVKKFLFLLFVRKFTMPAKSVVPNSCFCFFTLIQDLWTFFGKKNVLNFAQFFRISILVVQRINVLSGEGSLRLNNFQWIIFQFNAICNRLQIFFHQIWFRFSLTFLFYDLIVFNYLLALTIQVVFLESIIIISGFISKNFYTLGLWSDFRKKREKKNSGLGLDLRFPWVEVLTKS
ncbi:hypothetical protein BpHYR1_031745 [Brachionus plicatilis]|uniref:Uncharacterized protein n=1 Tax=Brachionus plicatilis TaxID=10195 RepID=A0A3M7RBY6_BRAPC|nr:hypothetical protein BpHYR1_031745 [Brachionus plicatilis]